MSGSTYTEQELSAFSDKLQAWVDGLPEREQQLLGSLVGRAAAHTAAGAQAEGDAEVAGFSFASPSSRSFGSLSFEVLSRPQTRLVGDDVGVIW